MKDEQKKILEIVDVNKSFQNFKVIKNINLTAYSSEIYGFLGPNGAGKTTTIKLIVGLLSIDKGNIYINGYNVKKEFEKAMKSVGSIVETPAMYEYLSGYDNLKLKARLYGVSKKRINEVVKLVGLENRIKDKVKKYSLGMKQRLGLARAILHEPKLLILDEPTNGLDPQGIHELRDILKKLSHEKGICVFISSHLLSEIELMCDKVAIINKGEILKIASVDNVIVQTDDNKDIYEIDTDNNDKAEQILKDKNYEIVDYDKLIGVAVNKEQIKNIISILSKENISIYEITKKRKSLEEAFLKLTNGGNSNG